MQWKISIIFKQYNELQFYYLSNDNLGHCTFTLNMNVNDLRELKLKYLY